MPILATRGAGAAKGFGLTAGSPPLICATGGTITFDGDYAIHTFTGPGTFTVNKIAASVPAPAQVVDYLVIGGSGAAPGGRSGGSGAGGYRESKQPTAAWTASPLAVSTGISISGLGSFPISVGAGGVPGANPPYTGGPGSPTSFSTITGTGGGGSAAYPPPLGNGGPGGSGGGGGAEGGSFQGASSGGSGNAGSFSPPEGNPGQPGNSQNAGDFSGTGGGGGGAGGAGGPAPSGGIAGNGGVGTTSNISPGGGTDGPSPGIRYWAGGGGGASFGQYTPGEGGAGGGAGRYPAPLGGPFSQGLANTGGGSQAGNGASGIVVIKYKVK
jgi:hypothetical protein